MDETVKIVKAKYKKHNILSNGYCYYVRLGDKYRYFTTQGSDIKNIERCKQEIDDFESGKII